MKTLACLNGEITLAEEARVSIWDRGFLLGDAVYEVFRLYQGRGWIEQDHMARLARSLREMDLKGVNLERLTQRIQQTIALSGVQEGTVYIQITRGVAPRQHAFPDPKTPPTELIIVRPYDDTETARKRQSGVDVVSYPDLRWKRCDVKSTNLLANVLANEAAHKAGAPEAVLVSADGLVTEATHSSLLWVHDGHLEGTPEGPEILPGTTRRSLLEIAEGAGISFRPNTVTLEQLKAADEVLLAGTTIEVLPVVRIDGAAVGSGRPGPVTTRLQAAFRQAVESWLACAPQAV
jgi:D-alanine transaminase